MTTIRGLVTLGVALATAWAQPDIRQSGSMSFGEGLGVRYVTVAEPPLKNSPDLGIALGTAFGNGKVHRVIGDVLHRSYFGYDLTLSPLAGTGCLVTIEPLSLTPSAASAAIRSIDASWKLAALPKYPPPRTVEPGDTVSLDLLASVNGRQKLVEYFQVWCHGSNSHQTSHATAKDFTLDDVTFRITAASLYVNGTAVSDTPVIGEVDGPLAWFYFPGRGRFLVSLAPRAGYSFQKAGTVRGSVLAFGWGADRYEVKAHSGILGDVHGPAFNLYVLRDTQSTTGRIPALGSGWRVEELVTAR